MTVNNYVFIVGAVLIPGTQAPSASRFPLIMRPYDQELRTCQRYYAKMYTGLRFNAFASSVHEIHVNFPAPMRIPPTVTLGTPTWSNNILSGYPTYSETNTTGMRFMIGSAASGDCYALIVPVTLDARL